MTITKTYEIDTQAIVDSFYQNVLDTISDGMTDYFYDIFNEYWFDELCTSQQDKIFNEICKRLAHQLEADLED